MPSLIFDWNDAGFNDNANLPNCRNGVVGQTKAAFIASLTGGGAVNHNNILFTFPNGTAIGNWARNLRGNLAWYEIQPFYILDSFFWFIILILLLAKGPRTKLAFQIFIMMY
jgi:hypothetical protein